ncbi:hypothetical protein [Nocardia sp. NPDC024068]|uniref:hypothetical protein n=1 Tax=Nocardia sp. NPDC024068 TaxID=3157197 RepID=UPI003405302F
MIVVIGLVILIAAVLVGVAGVFANSGSAHTLTDDFAVFGYHVTGSTGVLFLYGIVVGGIGIAGLALLLAGARRSARRGRAARRELEAVRRDTPVGEARPSQPIGAEREAPIYYTPAATDSSAAAPGHVAAPYPDDRPPHRSGLSRIFGRSGAR